MATESDVPFTGGIEQNPPGGWSGIEDDIKPELKQEPSNEQSPYSTGGGAFQSGSQHVIRVRGLPWSTKEKDVREFFFACQVISVHFTYTRDGRPTGEAYIEMGSSDDVALALARNRELLGQRYIEVFLSKKEEMEFVVNRGVRRTGLNADGDNPGNGNGTGTGGTPADPETVVRLRGLPFGCAKDDITTFFEGLEIASDGIVFTEKQTFASPRFGPQSGRRPKPGEAYIRFMSKELTEKALERHMKKIGHRYIEVFRSSVDEMERACSEPGKVIGGYGSRGTRPGPYSTAGVGGPVPLFSISMPDGPPAGGASWNATPYSGYAGYQGYYGYYAQTGGYFASDASNTGATAQYGAVRHLIKMRGLPFKAATSDIVEFFKPLNLVNVRLITEQTTGRPSGEAEVEFCSHEDAVEAMKKDRQHMGNRYIELFLNSWPGQSAVAAAVPTAAAYGTASYAVASTSQDSNGSYGSASQVVQYPGYSAYPYSTTTTGAPQQAPTADATTPGYSAQPYYQG